MVHTINLYFESEKENIKVLNNRIPFKENGIRICYINDMMGKVRIKLGIDLTELIECPSVFEDDYDLIMNKLDYFIKKYITLGKVNARLLRIDYKFDVIEEDAEKRRVLFRILNKVTRKYKFLRRYRDYESGIYFENDSMRINIYDRYKYAIDKQCLEENTIPIIRYEIQILNLHLNYNKLKKEIPKEFEVYFKKIMMREYMKKILEPIIYKGDYYNQYYAFKRIDENKGINDKWKNKLKEFMIIVSRRGIDGAKEEYSFYEFNKFTRILGELGVNPVLIPSGSGVKRLGNYVGYLWV